MTENVLITGASGFLGYHLITAALEKNLSVYAAVRKNSSIDHLKELPVKYVFLDYNDVEDMAKTLAENNIHYIIHAAGVTKAVKQQQYNDINASNSVNLAKAAEISRGDFKKMVFISSLAAAGPAASLADTITEQQEPRPVTAYGKSKLLAEKELSKLNISLVSLRPTAVYGPGDKDIFIMLKTVSRGLDPYMGKINQQLSFVHAADVATVAVQSLFADAEGVYNITDGNKYDRYEFADITKRILNKKALRFHIPMPLIKVLAYFLETTNSWMNKPAVINREKLHELAATNWYCDISKAREDLNFKPKFSLTNGLQDSIDWYKKNRLL
jgi:nucleoside-diphosphate-sugar epimerase